MITLGIEAPTLPSVLPIVQQCSSSQQPGWQDALLQEISFFSSLEMCKVDAEMRDRMETAPRCWRMIHQSPDSGAARANDPAFCVVALVATIVKSDPYHD